MRDLLWKRLRPVKRGGGQSRKIPVWILSIFSFINYLKNIYSLIDLEKQKNVKKVVMAKINMDLLLFLFIYLFCSIIYLYIIYLL